VRQCHNLSVFITLVQLRFADANAMRVICARDTDAAAVKQRACQELKATCKADLDTALPALNSAVEALKSLSKVRCMCDGVFSWFHSCAFVFSG
jgi:hypothetical protein